MKRIFAVVFLLLTLCACAAQAESVWVEETWEHVTSELDCDGLPMTVDAEVLAVTPGTTVREYQTVKLTNAFSREVVASIDWDALGFDTSIDMTINDGSSHYYVSNQQNEHIDSDYSYGAGYYDLHVRYNGSPYTGQIKDLYQLDTSDFGSLTWENVMNRAESAATILNVQIGQPRFMGRMENALENCGGRIFPNAAEKGYTEEDYDQASAIEVFMPAYYQGMRLYAHRQQLVSLPGEAHVLDTYFSLCLDKDGKLVRVQCPLFNGWTPKGEEATPLTFEDALEKVRQAYANMYLPHTTEIIVHEAALEYVPLSKEQIARNGFTVYPTWVFRIEELQGDEVEGEGRMQCVGIHAVTGDKIF